MNNEQQKRFFQTLFGGTKGYIEIRTILHGGIKQFWYETSEVDRLLFELKKPYFQKVNTYFGVCPRTIEKGKEQNVKQVNCLWADLDAKNPQEKKAVKKRLDDFDPEPSIIVSSGHGYHCYWLFDKPEEINRPEDILRLKGYNRGLAEELKGDKGIDLSRILRVPGTKNLKDPKKSLNISIIKFEPQIRYSLKSQFLTRFKRAASSEIEKVEIGQDSAGNIPGRFWKVLDENTKIKATWEGKRKDLKDQTRSGYDMALANLLMPFSFTDGELVSILGGSESGKGREAKAQYLSMTIGKAKAARKRQKKEKEKREKDDRERFLSLGEKEPRKKGKKKAPPDERKSLESKQKAKAEVRTLIPGLVHLVRQDGIVKYLLKKGDGLSIEETFTLNDVIYKPKQDLPVKIPDEGILTEPARVNYDELLQEVVGFIKAYLEMPSESHYLILALWIFHTYLVEKFKTTPILYFYGVKETGKTRAGEVLGELAFRCERLTSPTEATLFRSASYFKTSLIIDEIKLWGQDGNPDVARLIKSRYKRGLMVSRINLNKKGEDQVEYFDVFAPLVICTTESIPDAIESRCVTFLMQKNARAEVERPVDEDRGGKLRNRLTLFRASHLDRDLPEAEQVARRRLNEIMLPLYQVLMLIDPERKEAFKMIVEEMETAKEEEEGLSLEAEIVEEIINYRKETGEGAFLTTEIADRLNEERSEKEKITNMLVSVRIKRLGFQKVRLANGKRGFRISSELLKKLAFQFGLDYDSSLTT